MAYTGDYLVASVSNDFVWRLPGAHALRDKNAKNGTRHRRLGVVSILTETVEEKRVSWHNPSHSAWPWRWRANSFENSKSLTTRFGMRGVSTQQWPSTQITLFEITCQSAWLWFDAVTTPADKRQVNSWILKQLCFWWSSETKRKPPKCFPRQAPNVTFSTFLWNCVSRSFDQFINDFIHKWIHLGPKVLKSCLLHWLPASWESSWMTRNAGILRGS